ncbi:DUF6802 family protein [Gordonia neofelifaecis]|uniref:DUF6802 family protein n=1 Tax=Gordonia neofelifaecis TaxID=945692 RepID=UPI001EE680D7|nr:DUF6802 family protein [Gordonia neofelifaecis]
MSADLHEHLICYSDGTLWDLGPAEFDADGDGVRDSLTCEVDGSTAIVSDADGDARVDRLSILHADGQVSVASIDGTDEGWNPTTLGRLH